MSHRGVACGHCPLQRHTSTRTAQRTPPHAARSRTHTHTHTHTHTNTHTHTHTHPDTHTRARAHTPTHTHTHTHSTHAHTRTHAHAHMHAHTRVHMHTHIGGPAPARARCSAPGGTPRTTRLASCASTTRRSTPSRPDPSLRGKHNRRAEAPGGTGPPMAEAAAPHGPRSRGGSRVSARARMRVAARAASVRAAAATFPEVRAATTDGALRRCSEADGPIRPAARSMIGCRSKKYGTPSPAMYLTGQRHVPDGPAPELRRGTHAAKEDAIARWFQRVANPARPVATNAPDQRRRVERRRHRVDRARADLELDRLEARLRRDAATHTGNGPTKCVQRGHGRACARPLRVRARACARVCGCSCVRLCACAMPAAPSGRAAARASPFRRTRRAAPAVGPERAVLTHPWLAPVRTHAHNPPDET